MTAAKLVIFDLDGTVYRGKELLPFAREAISELRSRGTKVRFLTNNSSQTAQSLADKLSGIGISAEASEVYTSAMGAADWLRSESLRSAYVVGEEGLIEVLRDAGIEVFGTNRQAHAVVVGICRSFEYGMINEALKQVLGGAKLLATNRDPTYPVEGGRVHPGAGSMVAAIEACTGIHATCVGKPHPYLIEMILRDTGVEPSDTLVVGDRYETDILAGHAAGCETVLVLTGVATQAPEGQPSGSDLRSIL